MPRAKKKEEDYEEDDFVVEDDDDSEDDGKAKKKQAASRKKASAASAKPKVTVTKKSPAAAKRKVKEEEEEGDEDDSEEEMLSKSKKKPAKKPKVKVVDDKPRIFTSSMKEFTQPIVLDDGWTAHPPSLLFKDFGAVQSSKVAAFDFDGTLVVTKSGMDFPKDANDWTPYSTTVVPKLQQYMKDGCKIVIFSNAGNVRSAMDGKMSDTVRGRISQFLEEAKVPALAMCATQKDIYRKGGGTGMWDFMCSNFCPEQKPDISQSFFVGDSVDGGDEMFAEMLGLTFRTHEQEFGPRIASHAGAGLDESSANAHIVAEMQEYADRMYADAEDKKKAMFGQRALKAAAREIEQFPTKIVDTKECIKALGGLKGVGKGSLDLVKEVLRVGTLKDYKKSSAALVPREKPTDGGRAEGLKFL